jgi:neopullulanase
VMCVVNPNDAAKEIKMERFIEGLSGKNSGKDIFTGQNLSLTGNLSVPAKSFMLIELN